MSHRSPQPHAFAARAAALILAILAATDLAGFGGPASSDAVPQRAGRQGGPAVVVRIGAAAGFGPPIASGDTRHLHWGG
jgi:hypothetical protein